MHRRTSLLDRLRLRVKASRTTVVAIVVGVAAVVGAPLIAVAASNQSTAISCADGADLLVHPGGTWECGAAPSPSGSASPEPTSSPSTSPTTSPTTSPSPSPTTPSPSPSTSTTGPRVGCWADPAACGYPTPATTGYPKTLTLTDYTGALNLPANTVIDGKRISGCLHVGSGPVVIRNSLITCSNGAGVEVDGSGVLTITDTEITCGHTTGTAIDRSANGSVTAARLYLHDCENGFWMESNTSIVDSYIAVITIGHGHSDGIQVVSSSNMVIRHNTIQPDSFDNGTDGSTSSIIMAGQTMTNLVIADNLLSSGQYTLYCPSGGSNIVISGNRFAGPVASTKTSTVGTVYGPHYGFTDGCGRAGITWTNNVRDDTGAPLAA